MTFCKKIWKWLCNCLWNHDVFYFLLDPLSRLGALWRSHQAPICCEVSQAKEEQVGPASWGFFELLSVLLCVYSKFLLRIGKSRHLSCARAFAVFRSIGSVLWQPGAWWGHWNGGCEGLCIWWTMAFNFFLLAKPDWWRRASQLCAPFRPSRLCNLAALSPEFVPQLWWMKRKNGQTCSGA